MWGQTATARWQYRAQNDWKPAFHCPRLKPACLIQKLNLSNCCFFILWTLSVIIVRYRLSNSLIRIKSVNIHNYFWRKKNKGSCNYCVTSMFIHLFMNVDVASLSQSIVLPAAHCCAAPLRDLSKLNYAHCPQSLTKHLVQSEHRYCAWGSFALEILCPAERWSLYDRAEQGLLTLQTTDTAAAAGSAEV